MRITHYELLIVLVCMMILSFDGELASCWAFEQLLDAASGGYARQ